MASPGSSLPLLYLTGQGHVIVQGEVCGVRDQSNACNSARKIVVGQMAESLGYEEKYSKL